MDGCMKGGFSVRRIEGDEQSVLSDFASNVNIVYNGEERDQNQILNELYYKDFNKYDKNSQRISNVERPKKQYIIPDEPKPIEPGQVDPATFFGNSLKGLF